MTETISLSAQVGFPCQFDTGTGSMRFDVPHEIEICRTLQDLSDLGVVHELGQISTSALERPVTRIYRMLNDPEVRRIQGLSPASDEGVKFDITVLVSHRSLGEGWRWEYPKTSGHYHIPLPGSKFASPDFYQVISGEGAILLHSRPERNIQTKIVRVKAGDTLMIAPELGHTSVNLGETPLVFANVCVRRPHLDYEAIHRYGGAPILLYRNTEVPGRLLIKVNSAYGEAGIEVAEPVYVETDWEIMKQLHVTPGKPLYDYIDDPFITALLCHPDPHHDLLVAALHAGT